MSGLSPCAHLNPELAQPEVGAAQRLAQVGEDSQHYFLGSL